MNYKILVLTNKLPFSIVDDCQKAVEYFKTRVPFPVAFEFKESDILLGIQKYKTVQGFSPATGQSAQVGYYGLTDGVKDKCRLLVKEGEYQAVILAWNMDSIAQPDGGVITSWANNIPLFAKTEFIQLAINQYCKNTNQIWDKIIHELMHGFSWPLTRQGTIVDEMDITKDGKPFLKNSEPYATDGKFALTLKNLAPYFSQLLPVTKKYKYFTEKEVSGLKPELVEKLDLARELAGTAFVITSGFRTDDKNERVGGVKDSAHKIAKAVDLACNDSLKRFKIISALLKVGFTRIGCYKTHVHVDMALESEGYPQNVIWYV